MPELPEVETIRRQLEKVLVGQRIIKVECLREKSLQGDSLKVVGRKIKRVGRRAKLMVIELGGIPARGTGRRPLKSAKKLESKGLYILIHLKMTGQLVYVPKIRGLKPRIFKPRIFGGHPTADWVSKLPSKHTRVVIEFDKGTLFFNDMRVFGWVKIVDEQEKNEELKKYGPDVNSRQFTTKYLREVLKNSGRAVKVIILDQHKIGGIGNIYANDGLYLAKIDPRKAANKVSEEEISKLVKALKKVIAKSIRLGGASESDFVHADGLGGSYQKHFLIYKKDGEKCRWCKKGIIRKEKIGGRGTYYCSKCQK